MLGKIVEGVVCCVLVAGEGVNRLVGRRPDEAGRFRNNYVGKPKRQRTRKFSFLGQHDGVNPFGLDKPVPHRFGPAVHLGDDLEWMNWDMNAEGLPLRQAPKYYGHGDLDECQRWVKEEAHTRAIPRSRVTYNRPPANHPVPQVESKPLSSFQVEVFDQPWVLSSQAEEQDNVTIVDGDSGETVLPAVSVTDNAQAMELPVASEALAMVKGLEYLHQWDAYGDPWIRDADLEALKTVLPVVSGTDNAQAMEVPVASEAVLMVKGMEDLNPWDTYCDSWIRDLEALKTVPPLASGTNNSQAMEVPVDSEAVLMVKGMEDVNPWDTYCDSWIRDLEALASMAKSPSGDSGKPVIVTEPDLDLMQLPERKERLLFVEDQVANSKPKRKTRNWIQRQFHKRNCGEDCCPKELFAGQKKNKSLKYRIQNLYFCGMYVFPRCWGSKTNAVRKHKSRAEETKAGLEASYRNEEVDAGPDARGCGGPDADVVQCNGTSYGAELGWNSKETGTISQDSEILPEPEARGCGGPDADVVQVDEISSVAEQYWNSKETGTISRGSEMKPGPEARGCGGPNADVVQVDGTSSGAELYWNSKKSGTISRGLEMKPGPEAKGCGGPNADVVQVDETSSGAEPYWNSKETGTISRGSEMKPGPEARGCGGPNADVVQVDEPSSGAEPYWNSKETGTISRGSEMKPGPEARGCGGPNADVVQVDETSSGAELCWNSKKSGTISRGLEMKPGPEAKGCGGPNADVVQVDEISSGAEQYWNSKKAGTISRGLEMKPGPEAEGCGGPNADVQVDETSSGAELYWNSKKSGTISRGLEMKPGPEAKGCGGPKADVVQVDEISSGAEPYWNSKETGTISRGLEMKPGPEAKDCGGPNADVQVDETSSGAELYCNNKKIGTICKEQEIKDTENN